GSASSEYLVSWYGISCVIHFFFFSSRRRHTRFSRDWSSDVCSSDLLRSEFEEAVRPAHPKLEIQRPAFIAYPKVARRHQQLSRQRRRRLHDVQERARRLSLQRRSARADYRLGRKAQDYSHRHRQQLADTAGEVTRPIGRALKKRSGTSYEDALLTRGLLPRQRRE